MAKTHRGTGIRHLYIDPNGLVHDGIYNNGRGTCPVCQRTGVKVLYAHEVDEKEVKVCKRCNTAVGRGRLSLPSSGKDSATEQAADAE